MLPANAPPARQSTPGLQDLDSTIRALAHPLRRQILQWLKDPRVNFPNQRYGQDLGVCVGQVIGRCQQSPSSVSVHLALLKDAGLVTVKKAGTVQFLQRNEEAIQRFTADLGSRLGR